MADELRLSIEKLVYGGDGLAHADGNTVFVPYVLPGEEVRAAVKKRQKKLLRADLLEVIFPATERGKPSCPHFQKCGGGHYQNIFAAEQLRVKKENFRLGERRGGEEGRTWWGADHLKKKKKKTQYARGLTKLAENNSELVENSLLG